MGDGKINQYDKNLNYLQTLNTGLGGRSFGLTFDSTGNLFVADSDVNSISVFSKTDGALRGTFGTGFINRPLSLVFDQASNLYVANYFAGITEFNSSGQQVGRFSTSLIQSMDLAADQQTMYFVDQSASIHAFDLATNSPLPDVVTLAWPGQGAGLKVLPDGGFLVALRDNVERLDSHGTVIKTYEFDRGIRDNALMSLALDPSGLSFFTGDLFSGKFFKVNLTSGKIEGFVDTGATDLMAVAVFNDPRNPLQPVPEPSTYGIFGALGLAAMIVRRLSRAVEAV